MERKALPPAKISAIKLFNKSSSLVKSKRIDAASLKKESPQSEIIIVKKQVIKIKDLIATNTLLKAQEEERKRRATEQKRFAEKEDKLEKPKEEGAGKIKLPTAPKLGFLDRIKKFLFNVLLGFVVYRLIPHIPKLMGVAKLAGQALDFITDWGGKLLNGLVTFVDWGYKAYDNTKVFLKGLGGENFTKVFDGFIGAMDKVIEASIIAAIAFGELGGDGGGPDVTKPGKGVFGRGLGRAATRLGLKTIGRGGIKAVIRLAKPLLSRVPIIGGLLEFGLSWALGDPIGKALLRGAGSSILGVVGAAIGGPIGAVIGGYAGGELAGFLYDIFLGKKQSPSAKVQGRAGGGSVTRGGKFVGGPARREVKKDTAKREVSITPPKLKPGSSVGGDAKIQKVFSKSDKKDTVSPLGYTERFYDKTTDIPFFGPIFGLVTKTLLGDKPSALDYDNIGKGLNSWMNNTFSGEVLRTGGAFAGGGEVNAEMFMAGEDLTKVIAKSVEESVSTRLDDTINDLMREMMLKPSIRPAGVPGPTDPGAMDMINIQGGDADFWTLVAVASREDGDPQAWADVAQSIYNRLASGAYSGKTIKDLILGQMQYEPTWRYPKPGMTGKPNSEWYAIKDAASAAAAAGQSEEAMKKVAAAILDPTLQKSARDFIQGRTDFRGYSVSGGLQRKSGDNYFGWYNNYQANKIGSVPNFGATASTGPGPGGMQLGSGYGSEGSKIAGELGRYLYKVLKSPQQFQAVTEHPEFGGVKGTHASGSYHYSGRALDIGAYTHEQGPILQAIVQFNKMKGIKPVQLLHGGNDAGHRDHVHVAYAKGGLVRGFTRAILGEKGPEFVLDADTTSALEQNFPGFLGALNKANYGGAIEVLRNYAYYEFGAGTEVIVEQSEPEVVPVMMPMPMGGDSYGSSYGEGEFFDGVYNRG